MKAKCILKEGINGTGYENMAFNECREIPDKVAEILINFGYIEAVTPGEDEEKGETQEQSEVAPQEPHDEVLKEPESKPVDKKSGDK